MSRSVAQAFKDASGVIAASTGIYAGPKWADVARTEQLRPEGCRRFVIRGGRGSGKTRAGAEDCLERIRSGEITEVNLVAPTRDDVKNVMIEGRSGLLACARPGEIADKSRDYNKSELAIRFANGVLVRGYSAQEPDRLNGPQCSHLWCDEFYACPKESIKQARLGNRIKPATSMFTSTPKTTESTMYVLGLANTIVHQMATRDNLANLDPEEIEELYAEFEGTRQAKVELEGEVDKDVDGALWRAEDFAWPGFRRAVYNPAFKKQWEEVNGIGLSWIAVAVDPSVTDPGLVEDRYKKPDECGILVVGADHKGHGYTLADLSLMASPHDWAMVAVRAFFAFGANVLAYEKNQGGDLIREVLQTVAAEKQNDAWRRRAELKLKAVVACDSKGTRAEPVQMLYQQGRWHHCNDLGSSTGDTRAKIQHMFDKLENQQLTWNAIDPRTRRKSPNRIDALSVGAHALGLVTTFGTRRQSMTGRKAS